MVRVGVRVRMKWVGGNISGVDWSRGGWWRLEWGRVVVKPVMGNLYIIYLDHIDILF